MEADSGFHGRSEPLIKKGTSMSEFHYQPLFEHGPDETEYRHLTSDYVSTKTFDGRQILQVEPEALSYLARQAVDDVSHPVTPTDAWDDRAQD